LSRDLNITVAQGKNWALPSFWAPVLRYITAPILAIIYSFAYPTFYKVRNDPLHIIAFTAMHACMITISVGFVFPRFFDVFVPVARRNQGVIDHSPGVTLHSDDVTMEPVRNLESQPESERDQK
jgi:solute carrier family 6 (neurotransmitter transporter, GABA) member 1